MDIYDKKIDKLINDMDNLNISSEDKIKYLRLYSKFISEKYSEIENNFIIGTFISSLGLGTMLDISNIYLSILLLGSGVVLSLYKSKQLNNDITLNDLKEYKRSR